MGAKELPKGNPNGAKKGAKMKKAHPKASFAEQERTNREKDDNVCQKGAKMEPTSMPNVIKN